MNIFLYVKRSIILIICCGWLILTGCTNEQYTISAQGFAIDDDVSFEEDDYMNITQANNTLGGDLLRAIDVDEQGNRFISPLSLFSAMSMAYIGADGETKEEIGRLMHIDQLSDEQVQHGHASLYHLLDSLPDELTLHTANALWIDHLYTIEDDYSTILDKYYNATFRSDDFTNDETVDHINTWILEQTNGMIEDMFEAPLKDGVMLILLNTLYFQGNWMYPFDEDRTEERTFHTEDGPKEVPMMTLSEDLYYTENDNYQAVILPYGDGEVSMNVFLPKEGHSVEETIDLVHEFDWQSWENSLEEQAGTIHLPAFELEYESSLNEALQQLGMEKAFTEHAAFPFMTEGDDDLQISDVKQKSAIIVDEVGTEAASATSIEIGLTSAPLDEPFMMDVNRPFFFTITEASSGVVLFMGAINEPTTIDMK